MSEPVSELLQCPDCPARFTSPRGLGPHRAKTHGWKRPPTDPRPSRAKTPEQRAAVEWCALCDRPWRGHLRCKRCKIGIGPNHLTTEVDADGVCSDCRRAGQSRLPMAA
jgi:uncharacterized C2H2 Zn-finger protein